MVGDGTCTPGAVEAKLHCSNRVLCPPGGIRLTVIPDMSPWQL